MQKIYTLIERYLPLATIFITTLAYEYARVLGNIFVSMRTMDRNAIFVIIENSSPFLQLGVSLVQYVFAPIILIVAIIISFQNFGWLKTGIFLILILCFFRYFHFLISWAFLFDR